MSAGAIPVVVVGFGRMGRLHARTLQAMPEFRVVGVIDPDPACVATAALMELRCHVSLAHLPERPVVAFVAVPTHCHAEVVHALVRERIHCLVEKPAGVDATEVAAMIAASDLSGVQVRAGYSERFNPVVRALGRASPRLPATIAVRRWSAHALQGPCESDALLDLLSHDIDWINMLAGDVPSHAQVVDARRHRGRIEAMQCRLQYASGLDVALSASRIAPHAERTLALTTHDGAQHVLRLDAPRRHDRDDALTAQARAFAEAARGGPSGLCRLEEAFGVHRLLARLAQSAALPERASAA